MSTKTPSEIKIPRGILGEQSGSTDMYIIQKNGVMRIRKDPKKKKK